MHLDGLVEEVPPLGRPVEDEEAPPLGRPVDDEEVERHLPVALLPVPPPPRPPDPRARPGPEDPELAGPAEPPGPELPLEPATRAGLPTTKSTESYSEWKAAPNGKLFRMDGNFGCVVFPAVCVCQNCGASAFKW